MNAEGTHQTGTAPFTTANEIIGSGRARLQMLKPSQKGGQGPGRREDRAPPREPAGALQRVSE